MTTQLAGTGGNDAAAAVARERGGIASGAYAFCLTVDAKFTPVPHRLLSSAQRALTAWGDCEMSNLRQTQDFFFKACVFASVLLPVQSADARWLAQEAKRLGYLARSAFKLQALADDALCL